VDLIIQVMWSQLPTKVETNASGENAVQFPHDALVVELD
jgi:hypothetical protein